MMKTRKYLLDSGAFTASKKEGIDISLEAYAQFIDEHSELFDYRFNLDVIKTEQNKRKDPGKASYENWIALKALGVDTLPVYHIGTDPKWLKLYLEETDYIGLGAIANLATNQRIWGLTQIWKDYLTTPSGHPACRVHGLGLTAIEIMLKFPWYSVDSTSANMAAAFGQIYIPDIMSGEPDYFKLKSIKCSDQGYHTKGIKSFWSFPKMVLDKYSEFMEANGYKMGSIEYKEIRQRRATALRRDIPKGFDLGIERTPRTDEETLANSYGARLFWNYLMWNRMTERLPGYDRKMLEIPEPTLGGVDKTTVYIVITASKKYLLPLMSYDPPLNMLASYYYTNNSLIKMLTEHKQMKNG